MTELEQLMEQRKALEQRIKALKCKEVVCGRAVLAYDEYNHNGWRVLIRRPNMNTWKKDYPNYKAVVSASVIIAEERKDAVNQIPALIDDLINLFNTVKGEE